MSSLVNAVDSFIDIVKGIKDKNVNIGVMVSGGLDSVVLLTMLNNLKSDLGYNLVVLHKEFNDFHNHEHATELVKEYCLKYKLPLISSKSNLAKFKAGIKTAARAELKDLALCSNLDYVVTAHHLDDYLETILFRMLRGTGVDGLSNGFKLITEYTSGDTRIKFIKPLIEVRKEMLLEYAKLNNLDYVNDPTNNDIVHSDRNYIRHKILPVISKRFKSENLLYLVDSANKLKENSSETNMDIDLYSGKWLISELIKHPIGNRIYIVKEYLRTKGFNINRHTYKGLKETFIGDLTNVSFFVGGGFILQVEDSVFLSIKKV